MNKMISVLGMPGCGKSTLIRWLSEQMCVEVLHLGAFSKSIGAHEACDMSRANGELIDGLDEKFIAVAQEKRIFTNVILDGFPRSITQANLLVDQAISLQVICLVFPKGCEVEISLARQISRTTEEGKPIDEKRYRGKIERSLRCDLVAIEQLRLRNVGVFDLDATQMPDQIQQKAMTWLRRKVS